VHYREGQIDHAGKILAVDLVIQSRRLQAYYFDDGKGGGYYSETGKSMKKLFRKSPVEFSRVTSDYTLARFHPILGLWRAHRGVDYAAPRGSKVVATADGTVDFMGERGELGKLVILQHQNRFLTYYGHLDGFASGLASGSPVQSGQVIGYVGMTGLATGPHLHYEFHTRNAGGEWISIPAPERVEAPPVDSSAYFKAMESYRGQLALATNAHFVILD
jgi:murein DD-endopeptidase MepM/ murein hydrolase activator NlpD